MIESAAETFDVGGVRLERPFKVRRLGHCGLNVDRTEDALRFYHELLGLHISDRLDQGRAAKNPAEIAEFGDPHAYFLRFGTDHHSFVLFNRRLREAMNTSGGIVPGVTVNQISWQVGSLEEIAHSYDWLIAKGNRVWRIGRDWPGSNWNFHFSDPDGHYNELYYGMEQIGWAGESKPSAMHARQFRSKPEIPWMSEEDEIREALSQGVDLFTGSQRRDELPRIYDVEGQMLARPFRVSKIGPISLFVSDVDASARFYERYVGLSSAEEATWNGMRFRFLRANTEHHSVALYPIELRSRLGLSDHTTCMALGVQVASYRQLLGARKFLEERGAKFVDIPRELHPGIDYAFHVCDPDNHVLQIYFAIEQIGWDGKPRPAEQRPKIDARAWPETLEARPEFYAGEVLQGPLG